jgi:hypothetical protein
MAAKEAAAPAEAAEDTTEAENSEA